MQQSCIGLYIACLVTVLMQSSAQPNPAATNIAQPVGLTWFMQPFEQCGGTGGVCSAEASAGIHTCADQQYPGTRCPLGFTCQRQTETYWQCLPGQLQAAAANMSEATNGTAALGQNGTASDRNGTGGNTSIRGFTPAQIEGAGFRRFNISVWPKCAPWEYAIASRCVPAPNRSREHPYPDPPAVSAGWSSCSGLGSIWALLVAALGLKFCSII